MKTSKKTFIFFLLAGLMVSACGKNNSSGDPGLTEDLGSNLGNGHQLDQQSQQAIQRLNDWYASGAEGNASNGAYARVKPTQNGNSGQECLKVFGFNLGCFNWNASGSSNVSITKKTCVFPDYGNNNGVLSIKEINVDNNSNNQNNYCFNHSGVTQYHKNQNTALRELFQSNSGLVPLQAREDFYNPNRVTVWMGLNNGYQMATKIYVIDKSLHSIYNPIQIIDQSGSTNTYILNY